MLHLVADESTRAGYVCASARSRSATSTPPAHNAWVLLSGQRSVHFKSERDARRRQIVDTIADLGIEALIASCARGRGEAEVTAAYARR